MKRNSVKGIVVFIIFVLGSSWALGEETQNSVPRLQIQGEDFVDPSGNVVKFWGVNLIAFYPENKQADALAENLASRGINLVRLHHLLRQSWDWNPKMVSGALLTYQNTSREFESRALDRFDYLNAALRRRGIYLAMSANFTRRYLPGDADILKTDSDDRQKWMDAMKELNGWNWQKSFDVYKMLPVFDERCALLNEEFVKKLLTRSNPYTKQTYAEDPQILTFEVMNESSTEYGIICDNQFPEYWKKKLLEKWSDFAKQEGVEVGDFYKPSNEKTKAARAKFLNQLDEVYFERIKKVIQETGCKAPVTFSNLWRGETATEMHSRACDWTENHGYINPLIVEKPEDDFYELCKNAVVGKPFFVGELNQAEGEENIKAQSPYRMMLPLAACAYGSLHNWSGIEWFAWLHGGDGVGDDGWSTKEGRSSDLGRMMNDGMMIDHMRTAGIVFRRNLVAKSKEPITLWVDQPFYAADYLGLIRGKYSYKWGWQNVHAIRKSYGTIPSGQSAAEWMTKEPANPIISDTQQITKDITRKQLSVTAPMMEGFSGALDGKKIAGVDHLDFQGEGFATVILVADDNKPFSESQSLVISRTHINAINQEVYTLKIKIAGLKKPENGQSWNFKLTRPRKNFGESTKLDLAPDGSLELPFTNWNEGELLLK